MNFFDWYAENIYRWIADIGGMITGVIPFPVGELVMYLTAFLVALTIILSILLVFLRKREGYRRFATKFLKGMLIYAGIGIIIFVTNWLLPYMGTVLGQGKKEERPYSVEELRILRNYVAENLNEACLSVERDEGGHVIYPERDVMQQEVARAMQGISDEFPRLAGYYNWTGWGLADIHTHIRWRLLIISISPICTIHSCALMNSRIIRAFIKKMRLNF